MVRRCARLDANQARRQLVKECEDMAALQLPPDNYIAFCVDAVNLEN
jgi:hypothetical protein